MSIIYSLIVFLLVIVIHEFGHFFVAKISGVKVNEFSIGMGPLIFQKKGTETQYSLRAIPVGGFVAMEGEESLSDDPRSFNNAKPIKKIAIIFAGAFMNFVLAIFLFAIFFLKIGFPTPVVNTVIEDSPAYFSEISEGDRILKIDDFEINKWEDISTALNTIKSEEVTLTVERDEIEVNLKVNPTLSNGTWIIGITPRYEKNYGKTLSSAFNSTFEVVGGIYNYIGSLIRGKAEVSELSGPVGIINLIGDSSKNGIMNVIFIAAVISANLGAFNLLPIPALDGGSILIIIIESIFKKKLPDNIKMWINLVSLSLLFGLIIYVTIFNDILG